MEDGGITGGITSPPWPWRLLCLSYWEGWKNPNMAFILLFAATFLGFHALGGPVSDRSATFLLSRPVSRRQVFDLLLLGAFGPLLILGLLPLLILAVAPNLYGMAVHGTWPSPAGVPGALYSLFGLWTLVFYLFNAYLGCSGWKSKSGRFSQIASMLPLLAVGLAGSGIWLSGDFGESGRLCTGPGSGGPGSGGDFLPGGQRFRGLDL